jgi:hypothetical protein
VEQEFQHNDEWLSMIVLLTNKANKFK